MGQIRQMHSRQKSLACLTTQQSCAAPSVEEQVLAFGNILDVNLTATVHSCEDALLVLAEQVSPAGLGVLAMATHLAGVRSCKQYRRLIRTPCSAILSMAASVIETPSVELRIRTIR